MTPTLPKARNPIERRLELLGAAWNEFALQPEPRLLRWVVPAADLRMLEVFFEFQSEPASRIPDLFVSLTTPFQAPKQHGASLLEAFCAHFEEARSELASLGLDASWKCPAPAPREADLPGLMRGLSSFQKQYAAIFEQLVLVLLPGSVSNGVAWRDWLRALVQATPEGVRYCVVDLAEKPGLAELDKLEPKLVRSVAPGIDLPAAMRESARGAGKSSPGDRYRCLMLEAMQLAGKGELPKMQARAAAAMKIAQAQGWKDLQVIVHLLVGVTHLGKSNTPEALTSYQAAAATATEAKAAGIPTASKLYIQSRFGEGSVLLGVKKYAEAAQIYEQTAPFAQEAGELYFTMESWRMAGYCHQQSKQAENAWRSFWKSLEAGQAMDQPARQSSTLPYAGQGLLELAKSNPFKKEADKVRARMSELVGPDWEAKLAAAGGKK